MAEIAKYHPITKPPTNPKALRKTSKEQMQGNVSNLSSGKRQSKKTVIYQKDDSFFGNTLGVEKKHVERSLSWGNLTQLSLTDNQRSLSASNLYALGDPDLSIKFAMAKKPYDKPRTSFSKEKAIFTAWTQKYYYQLTIGCGNKACQNMFCKSSLRMKSFDQKMVSLISIELAGYKNHYLCVKDKKKQAAQVLDPACFKTDCVEHSREIIGSGCQMPFLYRFYSMSPFRSLFLPCPLTPSGLGLHKTHSYSELNTPVKKVKSPVDNSSIASTFKSHLSHLTSTLSSSVSNIFKHASTNNDADDEEKRTMNIDPFNSKDDIDYKDSFKSLADGAAATGEQRQQIPEDGKNEKFIMTRKRIPSVRIFGDEYAVDSEPFLQDNIDEFEMSVAAELTGGNAVAGINSSAVPESDDDFDEVEDEEDVVTDEEGRGYSLTHLTLEMFEKIVFNYKECKDETFLLNTLRTVFSSWEALMMSFQNEGISRGKAHPFNVKLDDAISTFSLLEEVDQFDHLRVALTDTIQVMLLKQQFIVDPEELKPLVIILAIPYLFKYVQVVHELSAVISRLPEQCVDTLASYIAECFTKSQIEYLVTGIKSLLQTESSWNTMFLRNNERVICLCKTIQILYLANNHHGDHQTVLPNVSFYCEELTTKVDFKQAYAYWKRMNFSTVTNSILNYPFLLEPAVKVQVIHIDAITQMREEYQDAIVHQARMNQVQKSWSDFNDSSKISHEVRSAMCPYLLLEIRRENLIEVTLKQLQEKSSDLKKPLKIKYTAGGEQGLDMGGLQKEFFQVIVETVFDTNYGLFNDSDNSHAVWFNAYSFESTIMFELVGILLGLAIYNGIILDVHFPLLVYKKLLGHKVILEDLKDIQQTLANGLEQLLLYTGDVAEDFCQTFEVSHSVYGKPTNVELLSNGGDIPVTNSNRMQFVDLYVDHILNKSIEKQFEAFKKGFYQVCNGPTIKLFTAPELELLVCGNPDLDFKALEKVTEYRDGYTKTHELMVSFWKIVHGFTFKQKQALLMFVTGSYRVPLKGLAAMSFFIQRNGPDSNNLPTSMTCFNRLLLPQYVSGEKLERMLLLAIENAKGFGLT